MAFKMKGNPMGRNFGIGKHGVNTNKHTAGISEPTATVKRDEGNTDLADGRSGSSPFQKAGKGYGGPEKASPAKGLWDDAKALAKKGVKKAKKVATKVKNEAIALKDGYLANKGYTMESSHQNAKEAYHQTKTKQRKKASDKVKISKNQSTVKGLKNTTKNNNIATTKKGNMLAVKKMQERKVLIDKLNAKNPGFQKM
jgi:hypothetical protein